MAGFQHHTLMILHMLGQSLLTYCPISTLVTVVISSPYRIMDFHVFIHSPVCQDFSTQFTRNFRCFRFFVFFCVISYSSLYFITYFLCVFIHISVFLSTLYTFFFRT